MIMKKTELNEPVNICTIIAAIVGPSAFMGGYYFLESHGAKFDGIEGVGWTVLLTIFAGFFGVFSVLTYLFIRAKWLKRFQE
jgi:hypothetical protein